MLGDDGVFALEYRGPVECGCVDSLNTEVGGVLQVVPDLGVEEQGFGRDATDVQAGSAQLGGLFNQRDLQAVFCAANGRSIAGWSATDDRYVVDCL